MFHFDSYWRRWSRVLSDEAGWKVEVNLTPISYNKWWTEVAPIKIRRHTTPYGERDIVTSELPPEVEEEMLINLIHPELVDRLLNENFLPRIDWDKYEQNRKGGGVAFEDCRKDWREPLEVLSRHAHSILKGGAYGGAMDPHDSVDEGYWWHITDLGLALDRTGKLFEAILVARLCGLTVEYSDIIETDCCHAYVPRSMAVPLGPDDTWVITYCTICQEVGLV